METRMEKSEVVNPIEMISTVGIELNNILENYGLDRTQFKNILGDKDAHLIEKITISNLKKICALANLDECILNYLISFQQDYLENKKKIGKAYKYSLKLFHSLDKKLNPLIAKEDFGGMDRLEDFTIFLNVEDEREIDIKIEQETKALYKKSCKGVYDQFNLYAWLRKGEIDFMKVQDIKPYNQHALNLWVECNDWKNKLSDLEYIHSLPCVFAEYGVILIYTPSLSKVPYGATRWFEGVPLIQISDREKDIAIFWKVLFHEICHVLKHKGITSLNDINKKNTMKIELEADNFVKNHLYNGDDLRTYIFSNKIEQFDMNTANAISERFGVNKMFVYYWARKAQKIQPYAHIDKFQIKQKQMI